MPSFVFPQVNAFNECTLVPALSQRPLRAHISGGHGYLVRFNKDSEQEFGALDFYDNLVDADFSWPNQPADSIIDLDFTKIWVKDALLRYLSAPIGGSSTTVKRTGYANQIENDSLNFVDKTDYPRAAVLLDRDVRVGDIVKVRAVNNLAESITLWTSVKKVIGTPVAASTGAASADASNLATQLASISSTFVSGPINCVELTPDGSGYDGLPSGDVNDTYDILVTESSVDNDFTTARLRVISGSGHDDQIDVIPAAAGMPTAIGTRGLHVTFDVNGTTSCSASASSEEVAVNELIAGQRWRVTIGGAFTKPVPTSGGTYTGTQDTTYIITVTRGGQYVADIKPQISVSTTNGYDLSGPTLVSAASSMVAVGTHGVTVEFSAAGLRKGDRYYITVLAEAPGPMRILELANSLDSTIDDGTEVDLTLYIKKDSLQVSKNRTGQAPEVNWIITQDEITIKSGITAFDETWTDGGVVQPLDVVSAEAADFGMVFVEYRAWLPALAEAVGSVSSLADINDLISGPMDADNPLKYGVFKAFTNSNNQDVKFTAVADPSDPESWVRVLELALNRDDIYGLVPLTYDAEVQSLFQAHVDAASAAESMLWRKAWFGLQDVPEIPIVATSSTVPGHTAPTTSDGEVCLCTITEDPQAETTEYTIVTDTTGNGRFVTNGTRVGDIVRAIYTTDGFGGIIYSEFPVAEVVSEESLRLSVGPDTPISTPSKTEIWRTLTPTEEAVEIANQTKVWGDSRVSAIWPDTATDGTDVVAGYFLGAALAGLASAIMPHQGMTNMEITGFSSVPRTTQRFSATQLDVMKVNGVCVVSQEPNDGKVFCRFCFTSGAYDDINAREEMRVRNSDAVHYRFREGLAPFIGVNNVTPNTQVHIENEVTAITENLKAEAASTRIGPQILNVNGMSLTPHATLQDTYVLVVSMTGPTPLNLIDMILTF